MKIAIDCSAILFDMDGTLVDSTSIVERQWKHFAERHSLDYEHIMRVSHGRRNKETIDEIAPHLATPDILAEFDAAELSDNTGVRAVLGSAEFLAMLGSREWAVVTSASQALARNRLQAAGLPVPEVLIGADNVRNGKPHPEGYLAAARRLGIAPATCLVFEDTPPGLEAARSAGMPAIGVTTTYTAAHLGGFDCVAHFEELEMQRLPAGGFRISRKRP